MENIYLEGTTKKTIFEELEKIREDYPTSDKGTIVFAKEVIEVLSDFLMDSYSKVC